MLEMISMNQNKNLDWCIIFFGEIKRTSFSYNIFVLDVTWKGETSNEYIQLDSCICCIFEVVVERREEKSSWPCKASLARSSSCSLSPSCTRSSVAESRLAEQPPWVSSRSLLNMSFICRSRCTSSWSWATSSRSRTTTHSKKKSEL